MIFNQPPVGKRTRHSKLKEYIPRAIEIRKSMDLSWRETAEVLGRELNQEIPHNSLFKAAKAWLFRQLELDKWPDIEAASKPARGAASSAVKVISQPLKTVDSTSDQWPEDPAHSAQIPEVKIRKAR